MRCAQVQWKTRQGSREVKTSRQIDDVDKDVVFMLLVDVVELLCGMEGTLILRFAFEDVKM